jgi:hypothetical protein
MRGGARFRLDPEAAVSPFVTMEGEIGLMDQMPGSYDGAVTFGPTVRAGVDWAPMSFLPLSSVYVLGGVMGTSNADAPLGLRGGAGVSFLPFLMELTVEEFYADPEPVSAVHLQVGFTF